MKLDKNPFGPYLFRASSKKLQSVYNEHPELYKMTFEEALAIRQFSCQTYSSSSRESTSQKQSQNAAASLSLRLDSQEYSWIPKTQSPQNTQTSKESQTSQICPSQSSQNRSQIQFPVKLQMESQNESKTLK